MRYTLPSRIRCFQHHRPRRTTVDAETRLVAEPRPERIPLMSTWNFMDASSKETLLDLVRREAEGMFALVATDEAWGGPTAAGEWTAANVVGHLVDTTETYFVGFDAAAGKG